MSVDCFVFFIKVIIVISRNKIRGLIMIVSTPGPSVSSNKIPKIISDFERRKEIWIFRGIVYIFPLMKKGEKANPCRDTP
jgi:hypothetical protein